MEAKYSSICDSSFLRVASFKAWVLQKFLVTLLMSSPYLRVRCTTLKKRWVSMGGYSLSCGDSDFNVNDRWGLD